jgi:hypothetical protein
VSLSGRGVRSLVLGVLASMTALLAGSDCGYTLHSDDDCPCFVTCYPQSLSVYWASPDLRQFPGEALALKWSTDHLARELNRVLFDEVEVTGLADVAIYSEERSPELPEPENAGFGTIVGHPIKGQDIHVRWPIECIDPPEDLPERDVQSTWLFDLPFEDIPDTEGLVRIYGDRDPDED